MNGTRSRPSARSGQPFRSWLCSFFLRYNLQHIQYFFFFAALIISLLLIAGMSPCVIQVLGFSNLALRDPWPTLTRSSQAYTPPYSLILRYGLAATLWLCIGLLQVKLPPFIIISFLHFPLIFYFMSILKRVKYSVKYMCRKLHQKIIIYPHR